MAGMNGPQPGTGPKNGILQAWKTESSVILPLHPINFGLKKKGRLT
jgi:hypothetical protein